jgi:hypothetical protein
VAVSLFYFYLDEVAKRAGCMPHKVGRRRGIDLPAGRWVTHPGEAGSSRSRKSRPPLPRSSGGLASRNAGRGCSRRRVLRTVPERAARCPARGSNPLTAPAGLAFPLISKRGPSAVDVKLRGQRSRLAARAGTPTRRVLRVGLRDVRVLLCRSAPPLRHPSLRVSTQYFLDHTYIRKSCRGRQGSIRSPHMRPRGRSQPCICPR